MAVLNHAILRDQAYFDAPLRARQVSDVRILKRITEAKLLLESSAPDIEMRDTTKIEAFSRNILGFENLLG